MSVLEELMEKDPDIKLGTGIQQPEPPASDPPSGDPPAGDPPAVDKPFEPKTYFKEKFGIDFEDEEKFKEHYSSLTAAQQRAAELESQIAAKEAEKQKLIDEAEDTFKSKYNLNDNEIRRLLILKEFPKSDPELLTKIIVTDYSKKVKENPMEVLIAKVRMDDPDIYDNDKDAEKQVYKMLNIDLNAKKTDPDTGEIETYDDGKPIYLYKDENGKLDLSLEIKTLQKAAKDANKSFEEIRNKIPLPPKTDLTAERERMTKEQTENIDRLRTQWEPTFKNLPDKALGKIKFEREIEKDGKKSKEVFFEFKVDENFKKQASKVLLEADLPNFLSKGHEYSKEAEADFDGKATESLQNRYLTKQRVTAILIAHENQLRKQWADELNRDLDNPLTGSGRLGTKITPKLEADHKKIDMEIGSRY